MIDKDEIEKLVEKKVKEKISNIVKEKDEEELSNYISALLLNLLITVIYYLFIRTPQINEKSSIHNIPSFPLYNLSINVNFDLIKENIQIFCHAFLYLKNGSIIQTKEGWFHTKDEKYYYTQPLKFLGNYPILNEEECLCIVVICNERDYNKLYGKMFTLNYRTYIINSNDHIEEKNNQKIYILDEELILNSKINEGKVYRYKIESNTIKKGDIAKNFSSISEKEKLRFVPPE